MKIQFIIPLLLLISCGQETKEKKELEVEIQGAIEVVEKVTDSIPDDEDFDFLKTITNTKTLKLPHIENTNFDSFIDEDDYEAIDFKSFKLDQIYPDFKAAGRNYRAISKYTLPILDDFHSIVVTVLKSENEMESVLINYDTNGDIIAHEMVSYDEIAESMSRTVSRITENRLTVNQIFWGNIREVEEIEYEISYDGTIEKINAKKLNDSFENFTLINSVLMDLKLDWVQIKTDLIASTPSPENPEETIVVIPEIVDEGNHYFDLNSHIVIADNRSGKITHKYFESCKTNEWVSDAVMLKSIQIDSTLYQISEDKTAFGVTVSRYGSSRVNPYSYKTLSLFAKSGDSLTKVLSEYPIETHNGEWNGDCDGEFNDEAKTVVLSTAKTNGYFDINVTQKMTYTEQFKDKNEECLVTEKNETKNAVLKFNGTTYTETDANSISYAEFNPKKLQQIDIENFSVTNAYQLGGFKILAGYYEPVEGNSVPPDTEEDWGHRLLMQDASNNIVFKSKGIGDLYLFEPHFYNSDASDKVIIICQMAFEYPFGGEVFILENEILKPIGTLDIEPYDENLDTYLTDVVEISELEASIVFTLKSKEVVLRPGSENEVKTNKNAIYVYQNNELKMKTN